MSWADENKPTINNEPTSYGGPEPAFVKLQKKYERNNELLRLNNRKLDRLGETIDNTLNEEQTINKNYCSKALKDVGNKIKRQRAFLAPYTQEGIQATVNSQVKKPHQALLDQ